MHLSAAKRKNEMTLHEFMATQLSREMVGTLSHEVASTLLEIADYHAYNNDSKGRSQAISDLLDDLNRGGCVSGVIGPLISYANTHAFFDRHYEEIEELRDDHGYEVKRHDDLKNQLAWFAFEVIASQLLGEFEHKNASP